MLAVSSSMTITAEQSTDSAVDPENRFAPVSEKSIDLALIRKVQAGDKCAYDLLVLKYQHRIANLVSRFVRDHHEVQDVTQEVFINAYRGLKNFRGDSAFYTWLYRIAMNTSRTHLLRASRRPPSGGVDSSEVEKGHCEAVLRDVADPFGVLMKDHIESTIRDILDSLSMDLKTAITLREFKGLSYEDIAAAMDCPVGTVRSRIFRAREMIDKQLRPLLGS